MRVVAGGACSAWMRMSNSENSIWRSVCSPLWKFLAASILSNSARGSGSPVSTWAVRCLQHVPLPAEVLHELAGQLHRIPLDAARCRPRRCRSTCVSMWCRPWPNSWNSVVTSSCVSSGRLAVRRGAAKLQTRCATGVCSAAVGPAPSGRARRPSRRRGACRCGRRGRGRTGRPARSLRRARCGRSARSGCQTGAVSGRMRTSNSVSMMRNRPASTLRLGEVLLDLLLAEGVARLLELLGRRRAGPRPAGRAGPARLRGEVAQLGQVALGVRAGAARQVAQEVDHLRRASRPSWAPATARRSWRSRAAGLLPARSARISRITGAVVAVRPGPASLARVT